jgi:hypothetical protein
MRKLVHTKIFFLVMLLSCAITQMEAVTVYVKSDGLGSGSGSTSGTAVNINRFRTIFSGYRNHTQTDPDSAVFYAYFAPGTYTLEATLTLADNQGGILFVLEKDPAVTDLAPVIFQPPSNNTTVGVFRSSVQDAERGGCNITFRNMVFRNFVGHSANLGTGSSGSTAVIGTRVFTIGHNSNVLTLDHVTIRECNNTGTGTAANRDLIGMGHTQTPYHVFISQVNIYNSSIISNNRGTTAKLINIRNGNARIYNNTFSGNQTGSAATGSNPAFYAEYYTGLTELSRGYIAFVNNTVYNSGRFSLGSGGKALIANNIFAGPSSTIISGNGIADVCYNNIIGSAGSSATYSYYLTGITGGTTIASFTTPNDETTFGFLLENLSYKEGVAGGGGGNAIAGSYYHKLAYPATPNHPIIDRANNLDDIGYRIWDTEGFFHLTKDQLGTVRPQSNRAIGSIDVSGFGVMNGDIRIYYNSDPSASNNIPMPEPIDLSAYVLNYAGTANKDNATFEIVNPSLPAGSSLDAIFDNYKTLFRPASPYKGEGSFTLRVSTTSNGRTYAETATVRIQVIDLNLTGISSSNLPGYDGGEVTDIHCKIEMKPVEFNPRYKFITGEFDSPPNNKIKGAAYNNITVSNTDSLAQVYDYHIPLVGDLNGDGRPEIVALGQNRANSAALGNATNYNVLVDAIHIFNGQTGKKLLTYDVPRFFPRGTDDGYHGSPGAMAIIDSDRDGDVEVILAVGRNSDPNVSKRLMSYVIHYNEATEAWSMRKNPKWYSNNGAGAPIYNTTFAENNNDANLDDSQFTTPVIQIVDFNKDGRAEILAYNKIFDAETGKKLLTYETLRDDPQDYPAGNNNSAYVGRDFKGKESWNYQERGNSKIGFASVYDLDGDGNYEICAGGKVYYNISFNPDGAVNNGTCQVLNIIDKLPATQKTWLQGNGTQTDKTKEIREFTDGRTAVADIDGDGVPEIVASYYVESNFHYDLGKSTPVDPTDPNPDFHDHGSANKLRLVAWNAHLDKNVPANSSVTLKSILTIPLSNYGTSGTYSYMYIADVDGREQNEQKLPEISMLGPMFYCYLYGNSWAGYPIHPNVADSMAVSYPRTGSATNANRAKGSLISFTWDNTPGLSVFDRLKVSFMMEHNDESVNTGISLFDFDNDGNNEICYRDERTLRIIKPTKPFVPLEDNDKSVTIFESNVTSNTGFEYPVIVDLDGDYSGDMLVSGSTAGKKSTRDFLYAIQGANVDLAPARTVWNQFMYSPLKVTESVRVPHKDSIPPHPLSPIAAFYKKATDTYETYIYNMNIGQVPYFSVTPNGSKSVYVPLVKIPNAVISDQEFIDGGARVDTIQFVISNAGEAAINAGTPIKIYDGETASAATIYKDTVVGRLIYETENAIIKIPLKALGDEGKTFLIRVGDDSFTDGKGDVFLDYDNLSSFADCDWTNNWKVLSDFYLENDYYTVLPGETVILDVLGNDILSYFLPAVKTITDFTVVAADGNAIPLPVVNQKLQFTAPATGGLLCYKYNYTAEPLLPSTGYIYIYVAELETPNTLLCASGTTPYELKVKALPAGVTFDYYESDGTTPITPYPSFLPSTDITFFVDPHTVITNIPNANTNIGAYLTPKKIDFKVTPSTGVLATLRWTGAVDTDWHNPGNWVEVGTNAAITYYPSACVNVEIPAGLTNYPELSAEAWCANIKMGDRAMIAGIYLLHYETAKVEFKLNAGEKDRFVMWSAPLKNMYSGDYHFKDGSIPKFGDVYMNMFQQANPDGSTAAAINTFTATFGNLGVMLSKGKAFNLNVTSTAANNGKSFTFPQGTPSYTDGTNTYPTPRGTTGSKFIIDRTDGNLPDYDYATLPVPNDVAGNTLVQVVNPYMAYLDVYAFLNANVSLSNDGYAIWDGNTGSFQQIGTIGNPDNRYLVTSVPTLGDLYGRIPPLQSFFVKKANGTAPLETITVKGSWTHTYQPSPYTLRADAPETNVLRVKAVQDKQVSYAVLHYNESTSPAYNRSEDMDKLFYQLEEDVIPLEVYTFAPTREVLAINSSSDFSQNTPLGLRAGKAGSVTLEFSGMATFGHDVYLIDHALNKETDLQKDPAYTFTVTKKSAGDKVIELNDRFSLRADYTGIGLGNEAIRTAPLNVSSDEGYIYVQTASPASSLQVYSATGALVYSSTARQDYFRIRTDRQQAYIVKVKIGDEYLTQKVFVK